MPKHQHFYVTEISLKRVQTFIFEVPRLKAMLGANGLLGETIRHRLTQIAIECGSCCDSPAALPSRDEHDPLVVTDDVNDNDDPKMLYRLGILARDGGHFKALFSRAKNALKFANQAREAISSALPGMMFDIDTHALDDSSQESNQGRAAKAREHHLLDAPVFQVCQETGRDIASTRSSKGLWTGTSVRVRELAASAIHDRKMRDIVSLMHAAFGHDKDGLEEPQTLEELCQGDYLALVHADGNNVGQRYKSWRDRCTSPSLLEREAWGERFFHSMRVSVRRALVEALAETFPPQKEGNKTRVYSVMMLGGDDLLLAIRARDAMRFALNYSKALARYPLADETPLDVGIGVAIAQCTYPIFRLHHLAEALAGSAKRLSRGVAGLGSVIDWQVVTTSWFDDLAEYRRHYERVIYQAGKESETLLLSQRPYPVLTSDKAPDSLDSLLDALSALELLRVDTDETRPARSALRALRPAFEQGRLAAEQIWLKLDKDIRTNLSGLESRETPWNKLTDGIWATRVLDLIGLREIPYLGSAHLAK